MSAYRTSKEGTPLSRSVVRAVRVLPRLRKSIHPFHSISLCQGLVLTAVMAVMAVMTMSSGKT